MWPLCSRPALEHRDEDVLDDLADARRLALSLARDVQDLRLVLVDPGADAGDVLVAEAVELDDHARLGELARQFEREQRATTAHAEVEQQRRVAVLDVQRRTLAVVARACLAALVAPRDDAVLADATLRNEPVVVDADCDRRVPACAVGAGLAARDDDAGAVTEPLDRSDHNVIGGDDRAVLPHLDAVDPAALDGDGECRQRDVRICRSHLRVRVDQRQAPNPSQFSYRRCVVRDVNERLVAARRLDLLRRHLESLVDGPRFPVSLHHCASASGPSASSSAVSLSAVRRSATSASSSSSGSEATASRSACWRSASLIWPSCSSVLASNALTSAPIRSTPAVATRTASRSSRGGKNPSPYSSASCARCASLSRTPRRIALSSGSQPFASRATAARVSRPVELSLPFGRPPLFFAGAAGCDVTMRRRGALMASPSPSQAQHSPRAHPSRRSEHRLRTGQ